MTTCAPLPPQWLNHYVECRVGTSPLEVALEDLGCRAQLLVGALVDEDGNCPTEGSEVVFDCFLGEPPEVLVIRVVLVIGDEDLREKLYGIDSPDLWSVPFLELAQAHALVGVFVDAANEDDNRLHGRLPVFGCFQLPVRRDKFTYFYIMTKLCI